jgi:inward rectifier potassium channel
MASDKSFTQNIKNTIGEIGFGSKSFSDIDRLIQRDGTFNVTKRGAGLKGFSLYHWLINMHWAWLLTYGILVYFLINTIFAFSYFLAGPEQLSGGLDQPSQWDLFVHCFYFSTQTLTTLGYGFISPIKGIGSMIAAIEAMFGLLGFAFVTGIIYGRFSKAKSRLLFSDKMLISPYRGIQGLKFRVANAKKNQLIEMKATVLYSHLVSENGITKRTYISLPLEIDAITMFPLPWTIVHPIEDDSPIKGKSIEDLNQEQTEFIVLLKGYDDTFNQYVHQIYSYRAEDLLLNANFVPMFDAGFEISTTVHLDKINEVIILS